MVWKYRNILKEKEEKGLISIKEIMDSTTLSELYGSLHAKMFGYSDAWDYFKAADVNEKDLKHIKIPTFILHAADDPVTNLDCIFSKETFNKHSNLIYAETGKGGHVNWFSGWKPTRV